ncbi:MAG TPA: type III-A CRISPR-associated RAMP protein Csm4 [Paludibacteraceae bacterium]|nr:type III-A CRISPR-associated RAMP protein Csm4 [Paludibacteraceae bacterium]HQG67827.1 type III-A CRISPR-associated RAMP protein Csm4 [Paludibacteraceae bacterium]
MSEYKIIKFTQFTPLHVGTGKEDYDSSAGMLQSDTLSAALAAIRAQMGKTDDVLEFMQSFTISSAFPYWKELYFMPAMKGELQVAVKGKEEYEYRKWLKKIKFIEIGLWNELVSGKSIVVEQQQLQNEFLIPKISFQKVIKNQVNQRVQVPRIDGTKNKLFSFDWQFFDKEAGLYGLIDADEKVFAEVKELFKLLGETGIGTDKNVGGGKFVPECGAIQIPEIPDANATLLLSLFLPEEAELSQLKLEDAVFELILRGGFLAGSTEEKFRHLRKKSVYMFNAGSLFPTVQEIKGKIVDLSPAWDDEKMHPAYRSGKPFCINIKVPSL